MLNFHFAFKLPEELRVIIYFSLGDCNEAILSDGVEKIDKGFSAVDSTCIGVRVHVGQGIYESICSFELENHAYVAELVPELQVVFSL